MIVQRETNPLDIKRQDDEDKEENESHGKGMKIFFEAIICT